MSNINNASKSNRSEKSGHVNLVFESDSDDDCARLVRPGPQWKCPGCGLINPYMPKQDKVVPKCLSCGHVQPDKPDAKVPDAAQMNGHLPGAGKFQQSNHTPATDNGVHSAESNNNDVEAMETDMETWTCPVCATLNDVGAARCHNCDAPKQGSALPSCDSATSQTQGLEHHRAGPSNGRSSQRTHHDSNEAGEPWKCPKCDYPANKPSKATCDLCDQMQSDNKKLTTPELRRNLNEKKSSKPRPLSHTNGVSVEKESVWSCPRCTLDNKLTASLCAACGCPHQERRRATVGYKAPVTWVCGRCTLRNPSGTLTCHACNCPRMPSPAQSPRRSPVQKQAPDRHIPPQPSPQHSPKPLTTSTDLPQPASWPCASCTYQNASALTQCEVCGADRGAAATAATLGLQPEGSGRVSPPQLLRQTTVCMEEVRRREEKKALEIWTDIVTYCNLVSGKCR